MEEEKFDPPVAERLVAKFPDRIERCVKLMRAEHARGKVNDRRAWLIRAIERDYFPPPPKQPVSDPAWGVEASWQRAWLALSDERRLKGLKAALKKNPSSAQTHIEAVIAGTERPRGWLLREVIQLTKPE